MNFKTLKKTFLIGICIPLTSLAQAEDRWYLNAAIGQQYFDSDRNLDDETTYSLGLEYRYTDHFAAELRYFDTDTESGLGPSIDLSQYYIDGLYYFAGPTETLQPFVLAGIGHADFDGSTETQLAAGGGIRYLINDNWSMRADARLIHGIDDNDFDHMINLGVSYAFGSTKNSSQNYSQSTYTQDADNDNDGVPNSQDKCLSTPEGAKVNSKGCILVPEQGVTLDISVRFAHNSDQIQDYDKSAVDKIIAYLEDYPNTKVVIEGHTDSTGSETYNQSLSERRAASMAKFLREKFNISESRLTSVGYGETRPIADNSTPEGRAANRRVVAKIHQN